MRCKGIVISLLMTSLMATQALANVQVPALFGDNMVLQRDKNVPVWGTADPNEKVTVQFRGQKIDTSTEKTGRWMVKLRPMDAGGPFEMKISGKNTITLKNVMVGEVWVCSGQSNMAMRVAYAADSEKETAAANYPNIRLFTVPQKVATIPQRDVQGSWSECSPETVGTFSATAYYFGRDLYKSLNVPIGLINTSWGGIFVESWISRSTLAADPDCKPILDRWQYTVSNHAKAREDYVKSYVQWEKDSKKAQMEGKQVPSQPTQPFPINGNPYEPGGLYNAMITPLMPYGIQGVIWYQGEANAWRAYQYRNLLPMMVQNWRKDWKQGNFPFLFVQLPNYSGSPETKWWPELRESQLKSLSIPNSGMAITIDIGEAGNIHPRNKQEVGRRLSLLARALTYGQKIPYSGPLYQSMKVQGNQVKLKFKQTDGGLIAKGGELKGFQILGPDGKLTDAAARIKGNEILVQSDNVSKPVGVRYDWAANPDGNLYNGAGLPASPFRTDNLPCETQSYK